MLRLIGHGPRYLYVRPDMKHLVYLIFGDATCNVGDLARDNHVWIEKSIGNQRLFADHRRLPAVSDINCQLSGMTLFNSVGTPKHAHLVDLLETINEHHSGVQGAYGPWDEIHICGIEDVPVGEMAQGFSQEVSININQDGSVLLRRR